MPAAVTTPAGSRRVSQPPTRAPTGSATSSRTSTSAGHQLRVGVDGDPGEDRDVDERGDQRGADEEADHQRAPGRGAPRARRAGPAGGRCAGCAARTGAAATAEPASSHGPAAENTCTSGSAVANARMIPLSASASSAAPSRSASRASARPAGVRRAAAAARTGTGRRTARTRDHEQHAQRGQPAALPGQGHEGQAQRDVGGQRVRLQHHQGQAAQAGQRQAETEQVGPVTRHRRPHAADSGRQVTGRRGERGREHQADREVDPEDVLPVGDGEDQRAVQRAEDAAQLLHRADHAERDPAPRPAGTCRRPAPASPGPGRRRRRPAGTAR